MLKVSGLQWLDNGGHVDLFCSLGMQSDLIMRTRISSADGVANAQLHNSSPCRIYFYLFRKSFLVCCIVGG